MDISRFATIGALVVISGVGLSRAQEAEKTTHQRSVRSRGAYRQEIRQRIQTYWPRWSKWT